MTRPLLLLAALALAVVPGAAGGGAAKTIGTRGAVVEISADGSNVAIHAAISGDPDCNSGSVWTPTSGKVVRLQDTPCGKKASESQYDALTLAGTRLVWTDYDFGNHAYCTGPYIATLRQPKPSNTGACPDEPDNSDLYWEYAGSGNLLVGRSYTLCEASCEPDYSRAYDAGVTIWSISKGLTKLLAAKDDTKLLDVDAGRILLLEPPGKLLVYDGSGKQVGKLDLGKNAVDTARLSGSTQVAVARGLQLMTYDLGTGKLVASRTMKNGAKFQDVENGVAVYNLGVSEVHLLTIATGRDRVAAKAKNLVQADLEPAGLFYGYNVPGGGSKPGRVIFVPFSALPK